MTSTGEAGDEDTPLQVCAAAVGYSSCRGRQAGGVKDGREEEGVMRAGHMWLLMGLLLLPRCAADGCGVAPVSLCAGQAGVRCWCDRQDRFHRCHCNFHRPAHPVSALPWITCIVCTAMLSGMVTGS